MKPGKNYLFGGVEQELAEYLEQVRLGKIPAPSEQIFEEQFGKRTGTEEKKAGTKNVAGKLSEKASQKQELHLEKLFCVKYNVYDSSIFRQTLSGLQGKRRRSYHGKKTSGINDPGWIWTE